MYQHLSFSLFYLLFYRSLYLESGSNTRRQSQSRPPKDLKIKESTTVLVAPFVILPESRGIVITSVLYNQPSPASETTEPSRFKTIGSEAVNKVSLARSDRRKETEKKAIDGEGRCKEKRDQRQKQPPSEVFWPSDSEEGSGEARDSGGLGQLRSFHFLSHSAFFLTPSLNSETWSTERKQFAVRKFCLFLYKFGGLSFLSCVQLIFVNESDWKARGLVFSWNCGFGLFFFFQFHWFDRGDWKSKSPEPDKIHMRSETEKGKLFDFFYYLDGLLITDAIFFTLLGRSILLNFLNLWKKKKLKFWRKFKIKNGTAINMKQLSIHQKAEKKYCLYG